MVGFDRVIYRGYSNKLILTACRQMFIIRKDLTLLESKNKYRRELLFGFNGKEGDNEVYGEGNSYNFEFRIHDHPAGARV